MNKGLSNLFIFAAGAVTGASVTYFVLKDIFENRYEEDVQQVKEAYENYATELKVKVDDISNDEKSEEVKETKSVRTVPLPDHKPDLDELVQKIDYTKYSVKSEDPETPKITESPIDYIDSKEYDDDEDGFNKITLTYFEEDNLFMNNQTEEEVVNALQLIGGEETLERFGLFEDEMIHVRNADNNTKYEIIRELDQTFDDYMHNYYGGE